MKRVTLKIVILAWFLLIPSVVYGFESGPNLQLRAEFGGGLTVPSISEDALKALNPLATSMTGTMSNLLMGGEMEVGYVFRSHDYFGLQKENPFSGLGAFVYLGFSQGNTAQKISAVQGETPLDIFVTVDYLPVVNFGFTGKGYFFNNRLALGLSLGARMIADMTPNYLAYSTEALFNGLTSEIGTIIVTEEMIKRMNPFMLSMGVSFEYSISVLPTTELTLGVFTRYNIFKPRYLTVPASLAEMARKDAESRGEEPIDLETTPFPNYRLDSLEFGVRIGLSFRLNSETPETDTVNPPATHKAAAHQATTYIDSIILPDRVDLFFENEKAPTFENSMFPEVNLFFE